MAAGDRRRFLMRDRSGMTRRPAGRWAIPRAAAGVLVTVVLAVTAPAGAAATVSALPTWPANPNWQALVPAPASGDVRPVSVVRTHGTVTNPGALSGQSGGSTVLTVPSGGSPAIVVVDFGKEVGGNPYVTVSSASSATLGVATSEALPFLTRGTNGLYSNDNGSAISFAGTRPRTHTGGLRGGFRFAAIQPSSPRTPTPTAARVDFPPFRPTSDKYQ